VHGDVRVNRQIVGFKKIKFYTNENVGAGKLSMPEQEMHTTAFWLHFRPLFSSAWEISHRRKSRAAFGIRQCAAHSGSAAADVRPRDLGVAMSQEDATGLVAYEPNLYLYDAYPGGIGQSAPLYRLTPSLLSQTVELIAGCPCDAGCPSCVGPTGETGERGKLVAGKILAELMSARSSP